MPLSFPDSEWINYSNQHKIVLRGTEQLFVMQLLKPDGTPFIFDNGLEDDIGQDSLTAKVYDSQGQLIAKFATVYTGMYDTRQLILPTDLNTYQGMVGIYLYEAETRAMAQGNIICRVFYEQNRIFISGNPKLGEQKFTVGIIKD